MEDSFLHPFEVLRRHSIAHGAKPAARVLRLGGKILPHFMPLSWKEIWRRSNAYARFLQNQGLSVGDRVAICGYNGVEWICLDLAAMASGLVTVPIYVQMHEGERDYILKETEAKLLVSDTPFPSPCPVVTFEELENRTRSDASECELRIQPEASLATIIYTSGTSGAPKGVMHSLQNCWAAARLVNKTLNLKSSDILVSYLPLAHVAERTLCEFASLYAASEVYFLDKVERLPHALPEIEPTILFAVPRIWEGVCGKINREMNNRFRKYPLKFLPRSMVRPFISRVLRNAIGFRRTRLFLSAAARLDPDVAANLKAWGIPIVEAYGLTETLGVATVNDLRKPAFGSVGKPRVEGVKIRLADDGEILIQAQCMFLGYYRHPEWTNEVLKDEWFSTGDMGSWTTNNNLEIVDRKKHLFKTSSGKYVAPGPIESKLKSHPSIMEAIVVGENRSHCVALILLGEGGESLETSLFAHLQTVNAGLSPHEHIKSLGCLSQAWSAGSEEMTATMKVRRKAVLEIYQAEIEELYRSRSKVHFFTNLVAERRDYSALRMNNGGL